MIMGHRHMVVAGHYLAAEAGSKILEAGGNAVDAGVAAGITLSVVHSDQVQFSGVAPMLIYLADRNEVVSIAGLGYWPKAASLSYFTDKCEGKIPIGIERSVVPAAPDAWITALLRFGTMRFSDVTQSAIRCALEGIPVHPVMSEFMERYKDNYLLWPENAKIWLKDGEARKIGDLLVQKDLGLTLQYMVDEEKAAGAGREEGLKAAREAFYCGDIANRISSFHSENGGLITYDDLAGYTSPVEKPLNINYRGVEIFTCGPWCQGPTLLQMLRILDGFDLTVLEHNSIDYIHTVAETIKLVFADREKFYGDPNFIDIPMNHILSKEYAEERSKLIDPSRAWPNMPPPGEMDGSGGVMFGCQQDPSPVVAAPDTSYVCAVDKKGNACSITPSDVSFEGPVIPGLGLCPSARGSQSFAVPGHASSIAPGKRPRLTPNPALALAHGSFLMPFGAPGGDAQPQAMLQVFLNHIVFGMNIQEAVEAPRFATHSHPDSFEPHASKPGRLTLEEDINLSTAEGLTNRGHDVEWVPVRSTSVAGVCAIRKDLSSNVLYGGADPRRSARAIGW